jgi:hypothetical protein
MITCFVCHKELSNNPQPAKPSIEVAKLLIDLGHIVVNDWASERLLIFCSKDCWRSVKKKKGYRNPARN